MPQYQENIGVSEYTTQQALQLAYACFKQLDWTVEYVTESRLIGYSKKKWNSYVDHIIVDVEEGILTITSKLHQASWDIMKRNKKNVTQFLSCFDQVKASANDAMWQSWQESVHGFQVQTEAAMAQEAKETAELDAVMNLSKGSRTVTYVIVGINVLVFLLMLFSGVSIIEPTVGDVAKWGGNFAPYTTGGQWWRLITAMFVHIGIIHIAFNMYALFYVGLYLEPMLGKVRYTAAYLCTGVFASMASIWWSHNLVSAGASGAIFGLYGVFFALLTTKLIPSKTRKALFQSIAIFIVYNLVYGAKSKTTDNAAHIGGLLSGFVIGYIFLVSFKVKSFRPAVASALVGLITVVCAFFYLTRQASDDIAYQQKLEQFSKIEDEALQPLRKKGVDNTTLSYDLMNITKSKWQEAKQLFDETSSYKLDASQAKQRNLLKHYVDLRIQQTDLLLLSLKSGNDSTVEQNLEEVSQKVQDTIEALKQK